MGGVSRMRRRRVSSQQSAVRKVKGLRLNFTNFRNFKNLTNLINAVNSWQLAVRKLQVRRLQREANKLPI
jgi:hypothetical protein